MPAAISTLQKPYCQSGLLMPEVFAWSFANTADYLNFGMYHWRKGSLLWHNSRLLCGRQRLCCTAFHPKFGMPCLIVVRSWPQVYEGYDLWGADKAMPDFRNCSISYHGPGAGEILPTEIPLVKDLLLDSVCSSICTIWATPFCSWTCARRTFPSVHGLAPAGYHLLDSVSL